MRTHSTRFSGLTWLSAGLLFLATVALATPASAQAPFGGADDLAFSKALWQALQSNKLQGAGQITTVPYKGRDPHGMMLETLTSEITVQGKKGKVVVKRNYGGPGITLSKVANNRSEYLKAITVMFKREAGFNPAAKDWFWAKYLANGSLDKAPNKLQMAGKVVGCIACHTAALSTDMVYTTAASYLGE